MTGDQIIKLTGSNVEFFPEFEQGILLKIINNELLDFDAKFHLLLSNVDGAALSIVQSYTDQLNMANFVQAIESLYYSFGEPTKFRNALIHRLWNEPEVDIRRPETLKQLEALIIRLFRSFGGEEASDSQEILSMAFITESIKMTPETLKNYRSWLHAGRQQRNLASLRDWLSYSYEMCISDSLREKSMRPKKSGRQPVMMGRSEVVPTTEWDC